MYKTLRKIRREKNISAKEMATRIGLKTEGAYYKKENGMVPFTLEEAKTVADTLESPVSQIFFD